MSRSLKKGPFTDDHLMNKVAAMNQSNAGLRVDPHAVIVRPAVPQAAVHRTGNIAELLRSALRPACNKARDTAHPFNPKPSSA